MTDSKVILGISSSPAGLAALRFAVNVARERDVSLWAVRSWVLTSSPRSPQIWAWEQAMEADARRFVHAAFHDALGAVPRDVSLIVRTPPGGAGAALAGYATDEDDLIVVGASRSRWWLRPVVRDALCPVVTVPPPVLARLSGRRLAREAATALSRGAAGLRS
ncbi:nucleotide-binding universal stress UspA family protein [Actinoplanes lutulentus]|uniref:universal stress protein n=1 Tax=Actinoplanes lutulentus TaxID=1287878 RepID=UPI0015EB41C1|nr:universal stress protein [Actinoplanes lutulentus]MBB2948264.1 nucleotide-binding universal stress UspA family protein [Actinoplanes lutulentus]